MVPCEKFKMVSFTSPKMKSIAVFNGRSRFQIKFVFRIAFESASSACCLIKYIAINLEFSLK